VIYQRRFLALHREHAMGLLKAQEEERAWVAREVHDDALQRVALVVHELNDWVSQNNLSPDQRQRVDALKDEIDDLAVMLRRVAHRLHPALIDQGGLVPALHGLASDVGRASGMQVDVTAPNGEMPALPREHALLLYRIAQEALRNVAKHANVRRAALDLRAANGTIELSVADGGAGFVTNDVARRRGLGLISMSERARLVDGRFEIWSQPGAGTTVRVTVPVRGN
jgi:two-component system sensor histidine kinase UhpB